jgi:tRNA threonylcarbamoyl adenosine modification protein YeaZ/ribosomal-protein-alanine acetyltransferase
VLILALDTCDTRGSVALLRDTAVLAVLPHDTADDYSVWLLPAIDRLLGGASTKLADVELYAVAAGPGSFTGVRAGLATVKAWSEVYGRHIAAVSRLDALAESAAGTAPLVAAFVDAHRNQIFATVYARQVGDGQSASGQAEAGPLLSMRRLEEDMVIAPGDFLARAVELAASSGIDWISTDPLALTSTAGWTARSTSSGERIQEVSPVLAPAIGRLGHALAVSNQLTDGLSLDANYVRRCDAEVALKLRGQASAGASSAVVRKFRPEDAAALADLAKMSPESAQWDVQSYERLEERGFSAWVIVDARGVRGFLVVRVVAGEAEILNLAVAPENRRRHHASALLAEALRQIGSQGAGRVFLEVRESNRGAILFYEKAGFAVTGKRPGYYRAQEEAAILMAKKLTV